VLSIVVAKAKAVRGYRAKAGIRGRWHYLTIVIDQYWHDRWRDV
jgi:hypothetical protein